MVKKQHGLKRLYNLHAWLGFQLAILMFVVLATGTLATLSNEIDWLIFPELRSSQKPEQAPDAMRAEDWVGIYGSVITAYPNSPITSMTKLAVKLSPSASVSFEITEVAAAEVWDTVPPSST